MMRDFRMRDYGKVWILSTILMAGSGIATAQNAKPDPCEKATSQADMNDCYGREYQKDDARLNRVYHKAMDFLQKDLAQATDQDLKKWAQTAIDDLKAAELAWIKYRDLQCEAAGQQYEGGSIRPMIHSMCLSMTTEHRIDELKQAYENDNRKLE
jgi:uncharacterized protein YecT (DUF1311 family)